MKYETKIKLMFATAILLIMTMFGTVQKDYRKAIVYSVDENSVCFKTEDGNLWNYETKKDFQVGEKVTLAFFDFEDCNPQNDAIVSVRKEK